MANRAKKDEAPAPVPEEAAPEAPEEAPELPQVIVLRNLDDAGNLSVEVAARGGVQATEVQTILELGVKRIRQLLGLPAQD